jgi:hypothetical protein
MSEEEAFNEEQCTKCALLSIELKKSKEAFDKCKLEFLEAFVDALGVDTTFNRIKLALLQVRMGVLKKEGEDGNADSREAWVYLTKTWPKLSTEERDDDQIIINKKMRARRDRMVPIKIDQIRNYIESLKVPPLIFDDESDDEVDNSEAPGDDKSQDDDDLINENNVDEKQECKTVKSAGKATVKPRFVVAAEQANLVPAEKEKECKAPIEYGPSYFYIAVMGPSFYQFKFGISTSDPYHLTRPYERVNADVIWFWRVLYPSDDPDVGRECAESLEANIKRMAREENISLKNLPEKIKKRERKALEKMHDMEQTQEKKGKKNTTMSSGKNGGGFEVLQVGNDYKNVKWLTRKVIGE